MVNTTRHPTYPLNKYIWELMKLNLGVTEEDYGGRMAVMSPNMEPEFTVYDKPFLVYGYSEDTSRDLYAISSGSVSYAVWGKSVKEVDTILTIIRSAMERHDETARDVNRWTSDHGIDIGIRFGDIYVGYLEGPTPEETEGGRHAGIITLRYTYFAEYDVILPT